MGSHPTESQNARPCGVARTAGVGRPAADWLFLSGPAFDKSVAVLELDHRGAWVTVSRKPQTVHW